MVIQLAPCPDHQSSAQIQPYSYLNHVKDYKYHIEQSTLLTKDLVVYVLFFGNRKPEENWLSELIRIKGKELIEEFSKSE